MVAAPPPQAIALDAPGGDCCDVGALVTDAAALRSGTSARAAGPPPTPASLSAYVQEPQAGKFRLHLFVDNLQCAACIQTVERGVRSLPGIDHARLNMSTRRLVVDWTAPDVVPEQIIDTLYGLGYPAVPFEPSTLPDHAAREERRLLSALAVAGFASANVMLLSVSVWAGAFSDMGPATRDMFHWISACIALPAVAYAGQPFFKSAARVLVARHTNMDVPISLAIILAAAASLQQTIFGREHAYFDASVMLLFFLLIGRYLDHRARTNARATAAHLLGLTATGATVVDANGQRHLVPVGQLKAGSLVLVAMGERIPVDGIVESGRSEIDTSLVTGETMPAEVSENAQVFAGTLNIAAPISVRTAAAGEDTLLSEIVRLVEAAEQGRSRFIRIADRAARVYAPAVHALALMTFLGWWGLTNAGLETSVMAAIAVLIITCPCALGLAVPVVQVVATGILLKCGVLIKDKDGLERLAQTDTIVFDKTGTLTRGLPVLVNQDTLDARVTQYAAALATHSRHPLSRATVQAVDAAAPVITAEDVTEVPGMGLEGTIDGARVRLGNADWCRAGEDPAPEDTDMHLWLWIDGEDPVRLRFADELRPDASDTIARLRKLGYEIILLSGDRTPVVSHVAKETGIGVWEATCLPAEKAGRIERLADTGRRVLMVGDGLNDAPALALGHASMSPASGADISQAASDFVFQGDKLAPVLTTLRVARAADRVMKQNIGLAIVYNVFAVPIAVLGFATPLIAAAAMSISSLVVTLNAFRLRFGTKG